MEKFEEKLALLDQLQSACTHCGLCSEACATFQATGWEHESPRGRLHLAAQFLEGHIPLQSIALSTFDRCLGCQACEPLCPHQVRYHSIRQIVQELRRDLEITSTPTMEEKEYQKWLTFASRMSHVWWRHYGAKWLKMPSLESQGLGSFAKRHKRPQVGQSVLAICCVQDFFQHEMIEQTLTFLQRLGYSFAVDDKQPCCGAIFERLVQGGQESIYYPKTQRKAASLQKKASQAFLKWMSPQTYFLSRGCQSFIAQQNNHSLDLYAWIEAILDQQQLELELSQPQIVYYQAYCRFQKGEQDSILRLLKRVRGLTVNEVSHPQACCGGYCGETFLHPAHAQTLAWQKISPLPDRATVIVTSPDCWSLFKHHSESQHFTICYPIQLLSQAFLTKNK